MRARHVVAAVAAASLGVCLVSEARAADQALIDAAIKEGVISYATNLMAPTSQKVIEAAFRKAYKLPDSFKVEAYTPSMTQVIPRVNQEIAANNVKIDWVGLNAPAFWAQLREKGELLEYCSPEYKTLDLRDKVGAVDGGCLFQTTAAVTFGLIWNPKYVKEDLQSWSQLTDPKYKGLFVFGDLRKAGSYLDTYIGLRQGNVWNDDFLKAIKAQEPFFEVRSTAIRDKVMTGEFPIAILGYPARAYQVRDKVKLSASYPKEGVVVLGHYGGILKKAPHPNAAKLWTDFMFSKAGQEALIEYEAIASLRSDAKPTPAVAPYVPDFTKTKAIPVDWLKLDNATRDKHREEFRAMFGN